jgi:hypothetical protein
MKAKYKLLLTVLLLAITQVIAQETGSKEEPGFFNIINEARLELKGTEIGLMMEQWHSELKANNIKLKLVFDEEGFVQMLQMISLSRRIIDKGETLSQNDVNDVVMFLSTLERLGCKAPPGLKEELSIQFNNCIGKTWHESIQIIKNNYE